MKDLEQRIANLEEALFLSKSVLSFDEASRFLNLSKSYLYKLTSSNLIAHYKPQGKMLYFEKSELEAWLRQNPVKTQEEITQKAQQYILGNKLLKK
ncbi:helix-turn-helix domain-containing protein [Bacteroides thetaiotaomicron]|uniref:helix-turn-helix domain-containing protein n=1 Tax=Bacteroides thetaiotaomicron TaxID=818 RepID=UPI00321AC57B